VPRTIAAWGRSGAYKKNDEAFVEQKNSLGIPSRR
jgi:hypothetical protein